VAGVIFLMMISPGEHSAMTSFSPASNPAILQYDAEIYIGTNEWEAVTGTIGPYTKVLTATGQSYDWCGSITMTGTFTIDLVSVSGSYKNSKGGGGSFIGSIQLKIPISKKATYFELNHVDPPVYYGNHDCRFLQQS
jgi:hypothetical protein